jgi:threonine/homoserine/homoserine lactone efflux protein
MTDYLLFATAFMASAIAPGADTFLIATRAIDSKSAAIWAALGITLAKLTMVTIVFFGVGAALQSAPWILVVLKIFGVGFLLFRAWVLWHKMPGKIQPLARGKDFATGFTVGFSNPQPFAFYLSVMPAIIASTQIWALWLIVASGFALVSATYILATMPLKAWLESAKNQVAINRVLSLVFVLLALWIALR